MKVERRLHRSQTDRMIFGVAGGLADYFEVDSTLVRAVFVLMALAGGTGILIYGLLAILMPAASSLASRPTEALRENIAEFRENLEEFRVQAEVLGSDFRESIHEMSTPHDSPGPDTYERKSARRDYTAGALLLIIGLIFLFNNLGIFWWVRWDMLWPLLLIGLGAALLFRRGNR